MSSTRLTGMQLGALNRVLLALYDDVAEPTNLETIMDRLGELIPVRCISIDEALDSGDLLHRAERDLDAIPQIAEKVMKYCPENPVVAYALREGRAPALRISDFATFRKVKTTGYYNEMLRYLSGWRDQAAIAVRLPESFLGFGMNRDKAFSDEELLILELFRPHLERVLRRSTEYLMLQTQQLLTAREREVLHWVAEGKRDGEIAIILHRSERTIEQHVRTCLRKLGVETRTAAAAVVWRARKTSNGSGPGD
jgi:DNA-binding CsgD family transcriptional regulator